MNKDTKDLLTKLALYAVGGFVVYKLVMNAADTIKKPLGAAASAVAKTVSQATTGTVNAIYNASHPGVKLKGVILLPQGQIVAINDLMSTGGVSADGVFDVMGTLYQIAGPSDADGNYKAIAL